MPAWSPGLNHLKRLGSAPKHHLVDPALACRLLQVGPESLLEGADAGLGLRTPRDGTLLGALFESLAAHATDDDGRHLRWLREQPGPRLLDAVIVTTGRDAYRRPDGIAVVPAALLGP